MGDDREALRKLCCEGPPGCVAFQGSCLACGEAAARILAAGWRPPPEPQGFFDSAGRITAAGLARIEGMPDIDVHGSPPEDEPPEPQAAASEVVGTQFALKLANSLVEAADAGVSVNPAELAVARVLLAEHARAEAAERERDFERKRANSAEAENLQMMRRNTAMHNAKEAAEAAVKRLEDAIRWVGPLLSERNFKKLCAALTPAGGGDGR